MSPCKTLSKLKKTKLFRLTSWELWSHNSRTSCTSVLTRAHKVHLQKCQETTCSQVSYEQSCDVTQHGGQDQWLWNQTVQLYHLQTVWSWRRHLRLSKNWISHLWNMENKSIHLWALLQGLNKTVYVQNSKSTDPHYLPFRPSSIHTGVPCLPLLPYVGFLPLKVSLFICKSIPSLLA